MKTPHCTILLDAVATFELHGLRLLEPTLEAFAASGRRVAITGYVARQELVNLQRHVNRYEAAGWLVIENVMNGTDAFSRMRELRKVPLIHKGEAELIAWAMGVTPSPLLVTTDSNAAKEARARKVHATDVLGLVVEACETTVFSREQAARSLEIWNDPAQQRGKPHPYPGFESAYLERVVKRVAWS